MLLFLSVAHTVRFTRMMLFTSSSWSPSIKSGSFRCITASPFAPTTMRLICCLLYCKCFKLAFVRVCYTLVSPVRQSLSSNKCTKTTRAVTETTPYYPIMQQEATSTTATEMSLPLARLTLFLLLRLYQLHQAYAQSKSGHSSLPALSSRCV